MHVDLVESLRCPAAHAEGWLVAAADRVVARRIMDGTLGCPQCGGEWRIADGELLLAATEGATDATERAVAAEVPEAMPDAGDAPVAPAARSVGRRPAGTRTDALRTAALLDLRESHAVVLLAGEAAREAEPLAALTSALVLAVNAPPGAATGQSRVRTTRPLRLGVASLHGAHLDADHTSPAWLRAVVPAVRRGGRLIAPARVPLPDGLRELARDEHEWVAEVQVAASGLVPLRRGGDPLAR